MIIAAIAYPLAASHSATPRSNVVIKHLNCNPAVVHNYLRSDKGKYNNVCGAKYNSEKDYDCGSVGGRPCGEFAGFYYEPV